MKLREVMTSNPRTVSPNASLQEVGRVMFEEDTGAVPVVENGRPIGIITDRDIVIRAVAVGEEPLRKPVREILSGELVTADPEMSTADAAELMGRHQVRRLLVMEQDRLIGIVSLGDLAVREGKDRRVGDALQEISQPTHP